MGSTAGSFSVKTAWQLVRNRGDMKEVEKHLWIKGIPFKINFFFWKAWKERVATKDNLKRMGINLASQCQCCAGGIQETTSHLFFTAPAAKSLWNFFSSSAGIKIEGLHQQSIIRAGWCRETPKRQQQVYNVIPALICWEL